MYLQLLSTWYPASSGTGITFFSFDLPGKMHDLDLTYMDDDLGLQNTILNYLQLVANCKRGLEFGWQNHQKRIGIRTLSILLRQKYREKMAVAKQYCWLLLFIQLIIKGMDLSQQFSMIVSYRFFRCTDKNFSKCPCVVIASDKSTPDWIELVEMKRRPEDKENRSNTMEQRWLKLKGAYLLPACTRPAPKLTCFQSKYLLPVNLMFTANPVLVNWFFLNQT